MDETAKLEKMTFMFSQPGNCVDSRTDEYEELEVRVESSLGIDYDDGGFFVLKTEQWAVNGPDDLKELLQRVENAVNAVLKEKTT
jgi:hypothetical protein